MNINIFINKLFLKNKKTVIKVANKDTLKKQISMDLKPFLKGYALDQILEKVYKYETLKFGESRENLTSGGFLKFIMKTMDYRFDYVYNDILAKQFNGLKTIFTYNTNMQKIYVKVEKARPLAIFRLKNKRVLGLFPKMKEFYNLTGFTTGYKVFQFFDNRTYNYTHSLKTFGDSKKVLFLQLIQELPSYGKNAFKSSIARQTFKKKKLILNVSGFRMKLKNKLRRIKYKFKQIVNTKKNRTFTFKTRKKFSIKLHKIFGKILV